VEVITADGLAAEGLVFSHLSFFLDLAFRPRLSFLLRVAKKPPDVAFSGFFGTIGRRTWGLRWVRGSVWLGWWWLWLWLWWWWWW
jgi:hypothetical protein